jgi:hypothetical protein
MNSAVTIWARKQRMPCTGSKAVFDELVYHADKHGECYPSVSTLADRCRMDVRTAQRHLATLMSAGLLIVERRHRKNGGQSSNLYRLPFREGGDNPTPGPCALTVDNRSVAGDEPLSPAVGRTSLTPGECEGDTLRKERSKDLSSAEFDDFLAAYPSSKDRAAALVEFDRVVRSGLASSVELIAGALGYRREVVGRDPKFVKHASTWLRQRCWLDHAPKLAEGNAAPCRRTRFAGPPELSEEIAAELGDGFVASYLDPAEFDAELRQIIPGSTTAFDRLKKRAGHILSRHGVSLGTPKSSSTSEAA